MSLNSTRAPVPVISEVSMFRHLKLSRPLAVLDLETTGTNPQVDRIVEMSILKVNPDGKSDHRTRRFNPEMPIPPEASAVHGIRDADVAKEPTFRDLLAGVFAFLDGCDLCGFNLKRFDLRLLHSEFQRIGMTLPLEGRALLDPMEIFHTFEKRDLVAAVRFYLSRDHERAHSADADVRAAADVLDAMLAKYDVLPRGVNELHQYFKDPSVVDSDGFFTRVSGETRFKKGKYRGQPLHRVARESPDYLRWMLGQDFFEDTKTVVRAALAGSSDENLV